MPSLTCPRCGRISPINNSKTQDPPGAWHLYASPPLTGDHGRGYFLVAALLVSVALIAFSARTLASFVLLGTILTSVCLYFGMRKRRPGSWQSFEAGRRMLCNDCAVTKAS